MTSPTSLRPSGVGPDKTSLWGVPVSFHANGADPGSIDLASLLYGWDFDDPASPVGGVGQDVSHTFADPGAYDVTGTVTDKDGASTNDTLLVSITKRATDAAYSGPVQSTPSKVVTRRHPTDGSVSRWPGARSRSGLEPRAVSA